VEISGREGIEGTLGTGHGITQPDPASGDVCCFILCTSEGISGIDLTKLGA